jgi:hypothetical protein
MIDQSRHTADTDALGQIRRAAEKLARELCMAYGRNPDALWDETGITTAEHVLGTVLRSVTQ